MGLKYKQMASKELADRNLCRWLGGAAAAYFFRSFFFFKFQMLFQVCRENLMHLVLYTLHDVIYVYRTEIVAKKGRERQRMKASTDFTDWKLDDWFFCESTHIYAYTHLSIYRHKILSHTLNALAHFISGNFIEWQRNYKNRAMNLVLSILVKMVLRLRSFLFF